MKTRKQSHIAKKHNRIYKLRSKDTHRPVRAPIPSSLLFYNNNYFYALPLIESSYSLPSLGCGSRARLLGDTNTQRQNLFGVKLAKGMALSRFQKGGGGGHLKAVFWLGIMFLMQISRLRFKQSSISMLISHIYVLGRFVNFLVIFRYIWR